MPVISGMRWSATIRATAWIASGQLVEHAQRFGARRRPHHAIALAVVRAQVTGDRLRDRRVVVNRQNDRSCHAPPARPVWDAGARL